MDLLSKALAPARSTPASPGSAPPRRTQAERREESEARLLAAAARVIAEEGYLAATLERVGEEAGFSRGLASRKFGSKDGLIEAVIWRVSAHVHAAVDEALAGIADPAERVLALFDRFFVLAQTDTMVRAFFVLFSAMLANRLGTREVFAEVQRRFGERVEALIAEAQAIGRIAPRPGPDELAYLLGSMLTGLAVEATMEYAPETATTALSQSLAVVLRRALAIAPEPR